MRAFIVASSPKAIKPSQHRPQPGDLIIAADGGANLCANWGWPVDQVVGDMDSIDRELAQKLKAQGVPFRAHPPEKDQTDLEIALCYALAESGVEEIIIAGALGARIDHTLGNLALLALPRLARLSCCIVDGCQTIWLVRDSRAIAGRPGDTLSLIPFGGDACGVSTSGVYWPLEQANLLLGPSLGISNQLTEERACVSVSQGALLVVHTQANGADH